MFFASVRFYNCSSKVSFLPLSNTTSVSQFHKWQNAFFSLRTNHLQRYFYLFFFTRLERETRTVNKYFRVWNIHQINGFRNAKDGIVRLLQLFHLLFFKSFVLTFRSAYFFGICLDIFHHFYVFYVRFRNLLLLKSWRSLWFTEHKNCLFITLGTAFMFVAWR